MESLSFKIRQVLVFSHSIAGEHNDFGIITKILNSAFSTNEFFIVKKKGLSYYCDLTQ